MTEPGTNVPADLAAEIAAAADASVAEDKERRDAAVADGAPVETDQQPATPADHAGEDVGQGSEKGGSQASKDDAPPALSEELLERAVRAGITLSEAKQFPSDGLLEKMVSRIEGRSEGEVGSHGDAGSTDPDGEGDGPGDPETLLSAIPDLDPDVYDEGLVAWSKSLKGEIARLVKENAELKAGRSNDWLSEQLASVEDFTKGDPAKVGAVQEKFDVLSAGYRAAGQDVSKADVFKEAAQLVLGQEMAEAKLKEKGAASARRAGQRIARPSAKTVSVKGGDVDAEVAAVIDARFG